MVKEGDLVYTPYLLAGNWRTKKVYRLSKVIYSYTAGQTFPFSASAFFQKLSQLE
jgi:hypothetical protein